ncbi:MAG: diphosphomevalonate decarboxylase [Acholeplasma sp.]|nr:diphosphomevalonate decarboxylase [Acholeplasma sp.]
MKARAYVNFALIKYWGKKDDRLRLPHQASLSFTVDKLYTETEVVYDDKLESDVIIVNGNSDLAVNKRVSNHMDIIRKEHGIDKYAYINSNNFVPIAAGLASSASAFAALSLAATTSYGLNLDKKKLSRLARLGSGSASRSIYGDFVIWHKGDDDSSVAEKLNIKWDEFRIIVCIVSKDEKEYGSSEAMEKSLQNKKGFDKWVKTSEKDLESMLLALDEKNIDKVGLIAEQNANSMHDLIEESGIIYKNNDSIEVINTVYKMRDKGIKVYYTMDAGPNVKLITVENEVEKILAELKNINTIVCKAGFDAHEV